MAFVGGFKTLPIRALSATAELAAARGSAKRRAIAAADGSPLRLTIATDDPLADDGSPVRLTIATDDPPADDGSPLRLSERFGADGADPAVEADVSASPDNAEVKVIRLSNNEWWCTERFKACEDCRTFTKQYTSLELKDMARECNLRSNGKKSDLASALWAYAAVAVEG